MFIFRWMITAVKLAIPLTQWFVLSFFTRVEYYDCALLGGFSYVFMRAMFGFSNWLAIIVAVALIGLYLFLYKKKIWFWTIRISFSALWGYVFSSLLTYLFTLDQIWQIAVFVGFAALSYFGHADLDMKREVFARVDAEMKAEKLRR